MLAMLFIAERRVVHNEGLDLLSPRDIVDMLKETLPPNCVHHFASKVIRSMPARNQHAVNFRYAAPASRRTDYDTAASFPERDFVKRPLEPAIAR
jgi:hypothetical protein